MSEQILVVTPAGPARVTLRRAAGKPWCLLLVSHGAGGGIEARDLVALADALPAHGVTVGLVEQPWRVAGKKLAPAPGRLDEGWRAVMAALHGSGETKGLTVVAGGRSAGARVACRVGRETGASAVLALSFPLHPPGKPAKSRAEELLGAGAPVLVLQGERDPFGRPEEFPALPGSMRLVPVPAGDHGFAVPKRAAVTQEESLAVLTRAATDWLLELRG